MDELTEMVQPTKPLTEVVICNNDDDVELAQDPFGENDLMFPIKEEIAEPTFEDFDYNEVQLVQMRIKPDINVQSDHEESNFDQSNNFDQNNDFQTDDYSDDDFAPLASTQEPKSNIDETIVPQLKCEVNYGSDEIKNEFDKSADVPKTEKVDRPKRKCTTAVKSGKEKSIKKKNAVAKTGDVKKVDSKTNVGKRKKGRPKSEIPHQCSICGKQYEYASLLKVHTRTHLINKGHNCPVCQKSFARLDHYKQHINNVHKGEVVEGVVRKPSFERKCEICEKIFHHSGNLRKHMLLHSGERPFSCTECGYVYYFT